MSARRQSLRCNRTPAWQILFGLMGLAFLLRSLVPLGYMPTKAESGSFPVAITLCSVGGVSVTKLTSDHSGVPTDRDHLFESCPYGLAMAYKLLLCSGELQLAHDFAYQPIVVRQLAPSTPLLLAAGPPLGSRAPPMDLLQVLNA